MLWQYLRLEIDPVFNLYFADLSAPVGVSQITSEVMMYRMPNY